MGVMTGFRYFTELPIFSLLLMTSSCHAHLDRHRYDIVASRDVASDAKKNSWDRFLVRSVQARGMTLN